MNAAASSGGGKPVSAPASMRPLALTAEERKELSDVLGTVVSFFVVALRDARVGRDEALRRAEKAERWVARLSAKPDGEVRETAVGGGGADR